MVEKQEIFKENKFKRLHLSFIFFMIVVIASVGFYYYDNVLKKANADIQKLIDIKQGEIDKLKEDNNLQILDLLDTNKNVINKLKAYSEITTFINHLEDLSSIYAIEFSGFNFNAGVLTTSISSVTDEASEKKEVFYNYQKTARFIKEYRNDTDAMFNLEFIKSITTKGNDTETFDITLTLKDEFIDKINKKENLDKEVKDTTSLEKVIVNKEENN